MATQLHARRRVRHRTGADGRQTAPIGGAGVRRPRERRPGRCRRVDWRSMPSAANAKRSAGLIAPEERWDITGLTGARAAGGLTVDFVVVPYRAERLRSSAAR